MAKINLAQSRLNRVLERYTLPECTSKPGYVGTFCME